MKISTLIKSLILIVFFLFNLTVVAKGKTTVESCNRTVTFDELSNDVNLTEMMLVLGLADRMVGYTGISGWKTLDEEMRAGVKELPELSQKYPSKEVLVGADADFFFAGWNYGMKVGGEVTPETLEPFGINKLTESCIHIMNKSKANMEDMYNDLLNLGRIFSVEDKANELINNYRMEIQELTKNINTDDPLRVFVYDSGEDTPFTAGFYAMPTALSSGGINIMNDFKKSSVTWEEVRQKSRGHSNCKM